MALEYLQRIELSISFAEFERLPRNSAYKYEYFDGRAVLSPRPKVHHAVLDLQPLSAPERGEVRPLPRAEIPGLAGLFAAAFARAQPFAGLDAGAARAAAQQCLAKTHTGGDGPIVESACFQAFERHFAGPVGAILVTLLPAELLDDESVYCWPEPPPADAVERGLGCPHLTWVFVSPWVVRRGLATALLAAARRALLELGYRHLASTFLLGNDSSTLWHWRNGFRLRSHDWPDRRTNG